MACILVLVAYSTLEATNITGFRLMKKHKPCGICFYHFFNLHRNEIYLISAKPIWGIKLSSCCLWPEIVPPKKTKVTINPTVNIFAIANNTPETIVGCVETVQKNFETVIRNFRLETTKKDYRSIKYLFQKPTLLTGN